MDKRKIDAGNWFIDQLNVYQSANSDFSSIKNNFIIREAEFEIITNSLANKNANDPLQQELILGRRGSGKSTLLKRIEIEIIENNKLTTKYIAINLAEEQAGIYRLFDLWEQVIEELKHKLNIEIQIQEFSQFDNNQDYTRYLYQVIHELCNKHKKKIVLLLDNFDRIVENFTDDGNLLRETLINYNDIEIIAGSTRMDEHFWRYDMPFYEFLRRHRLEALSREEIFKLLYHWSNLLNIPELKTFIDNNPGKIENIRILTDGLPRTIQFFIQMVLQNNNANSYDYLKKVMDNVTPLYQERLNNLPAQMRKTVLEMAFIWEACTTKQLVEKVKMESKLISANLKTLVDKGIVEKIETSKKNHLYRISERFFNLWLIITQGNPEQKRKAKWLSIFLENWYDASDFRTLSAKHIANLKNNNLNWEKAIIQTKALCQSKYISLEERDTILELTEEKKDYTNSNCLIELPKKFSEIHKDLSKLVKHKEFDKAIEATCNIENEEDGHKFFMLGYLYNNLKNNELAEQYYLMAIEKGHLEALNNLANLYYNQGDFENAEKYYLYAINKGETKALKNIALLYNNLKKFSEAEKYFLLAIEHGEINALNSLAVLYNNLGKHKKAEKYFLLSIESGNSMAMFNLALLFENQNNFKDAEKYYLLAIGKNNIDAMFNLALLYHKQNRDEKTEKYLLLAISCGDIDAMFNLALLYEKQGKQKVAEKYYLMAIEKGDDFAMNNLAYLYYNKNIKKTESLNLINNCVSTSKNKLNIKIQIIIEIWNGIFSDIENRVYRSIIEDNDENLNLNFLTELLIQQQKNLVLRLFRNKEFGKMLQEKYAVLYYVSLILNNVQEENLALRIPPELQSTIDDVIAQIKEREIFYGYK